MHSHVGAFLQVFVTMPIFCWSKQPHNRHGMQGRMPFRHGLLECTVVTGTYPQDSFFLKQKMDHIEGKGMRKDRHADGEMPGKIPLTGSLSDRLDQLDKRETELLKEKGRLEKDVSRLREDKTKFRQKVEQFE